VWIKIAAVQQRPVGTAFYVILHSARLWAAQTCIFPAEPSKKQSSIK
jgi:hypothetical protein